MTGRRDVADDAHGTHPGAEAGLVAAARGDPTAFGPLYEAHVDRIYRHAFRHLGDHAAAEEVTAQTFRQALAALPSYESSALPFGAWLLQLADDILAQQGRSGTEGAPPAWAETRRTWPSLLTAVRRLPLDQQRAVVLAFARGLSGREIGAIMERDESEVRELLHRALLTLRLQLQLERGQDGDEGERHDG